MYSSEYVAYKHILDDSRTPTKETHARTTSAARLISCPRYLQPIKSRSQFERKLELDSRSYMNDFILISEFSEIEGPKPLFSIPVDGGLDFNKNEYSLHVMCVDFHVQNVNKFALNKDTSIINQWNLSNGAVASYVHHFTLYDIEARGFVRPFCISYITYDKLKINKYFNQITREVTQVTSLLKKSNFALFRVELEQRLANLKYTRVAYDEWLITSDEEKLNFYEKYHLDGRIEAKFQKYSLQTIDMIINQLNNLVNVINDYLLENNLMVNGKEEKTQEKSKSTNENGFYHEALNVQERSQSYPSYATSSQTTHPKIIFDLQTGATIASSHNHEPIGFSSKTQSAKLMKNIHELARDTARLAINKLRLIHKTYSRSYATLKYRDIELYYLRNSNKNWCLTMGECLMNDFCSQDLAKLSNDMNIDGQKEDEFYTPLCANSLNDYDYENTEASDQQAAQTINCLSRTLSNISFSDQDETDYDFAESYKRHEEHVTSNEMFLVADKYCKLSELNFEAILKLTMLKNYKNFLHHLLYTLMRGRPLVIISRYKSDLEKLTSISNCLVSFIPNAQSTLKVTYESKPIKLIDIKTYNLICLTMGINKLSLIDAKTHLPVPFDDSLLLLKYIPITVRNYVSILDIDKNTFVGPKYTGVYLTSILSKLKYFQEDSVSFLFILSRLNYYSKLAYLYSYSWLFQDACHGASSLLDGSLHKFSDRRESVVSRTSSSARSSINSITETTTSNGSSEPPEQVREKMALFKTHLLTYSCMSSHHYFDVCDYNVVDWLLRSLQLKQVHEYNQEQQHHQQQQQQPLIVNYEHLVTFNS